MLKRRRKKKSREPDAHIECRLYCSAQLLAKRTQPDELGYAPQCTNEEMEPYCLSCIHPTEELVLCHLEVLPE